MSIGKKKIKATEEQRELMKQLRKVNLRIRAVVRLRNATEKNMREFSLALNELQRDYGKAIASFTKGKDIGLRGR